ncbi:energy transducer TonB [Psychroserpens sp. MEBiC05023]
MKKQTVITFVIITSLIIGSISAYNWTSKSSTKDTVLKTTSTIPIEDQNMVTNTFKVFPDFIYDIGPRFSGIKKSKINTITSIEAFLDDEIMLEIAKVKSTSITLIENEEMSSHRAKGQSKMLTDAQINLLRNSTYSTNFVMRVDYEEKPKTNGHQTDNYRTPHLTIVPEYEAIYSHGKAALKSFLKESCQSVLINVDPEQLKPAKLYFTVNKEGNIEEVSLDRASGYPEVDKKMIELIKNTPGTWQPAKNDKGEPVDQKLVVSFGLMGC